MHKIELNAKSRKTYNHKKFWKNEIQNNPHHKPHNKKSFDYYPRGRVAIANNRADIYLNQNINKPTILSEIKQRFGLHGVSKVRVIVDNSTHYQCFIDTE
jgi:hypothetical protein